ncbi:MAG: hypothetical protein ACYS0I_05940 [Planctomycetota bacterium]|jgi:hypothetical protein
MKRFGQLMIAIAFLGGALAAVLDKVNVQWGLFVPVVGLGAGGAIMVHLGKKRKIRSKEKLAMGMQNVETGLKTIAEKVKLLNSEKQLINPYEVRHRIDQLLPEHLSKFVEARETIAHRYGLQAYANVMSHFAAGERYLNRVWSASADGYIDEVNTYLDKAQEQFVEALAQVRQLRQ